VLCGTYKSAPATLLKEHGCAAAGAGGLAAVGCLQFIDRATTSSSKHGQLQHTCAAQA
jgi:hypothetical protein